MPVPTKNAASASAGGKSAARPLFSPAGRRWPEGSDEGGRTRQDGRGRAMSDEDIRKRRPGKTVQARRLRRSETEEEFRLWSELRNRHLNGHKFARQVPLGPYIVDFLCREERLIVEIDGFHHAGSEPDLTRTRWLNRNGYAVLRFWNHEVTRERRAVLETILAALSGCLNQHCHATRFYPSLTIGLESTGE
ncbi:endonuclease domain-containing protein [Rhizobium sp. GN54]|uniref:endonuclease domain-containing protein n=1 Tax=Rhizobium sp. GN54 TaxID=2898150 RepID=UPI003FA7D02A